MSACAVCYEDSDDLTCAGCVSEARAELQATLDAEREKHAAEVAETTALLRSDTGELWVDECERARKQRDDALAKLRALVAEVTGHKPSNVHGRTLGDCVEAMLVSPALREAEELLGKYPH
jgi:hypothetical protein